MFYIFYTLLTHLPIFGLVYQKAFDLPLSKEDENKLITKMQQGDKKAREKLICHNLRLVAHIAKKYENNMDDLEDLISIGTIGLIKAIDSFHDDKQTKLGTYAAKCISNEILMHLRSNKKRSLDVSMNDCISKDGDGNDITIEDTIASNDTLPIEDLKLQEDIEEMKSYFHLLDVKEQEILYYRYGLFNYPILTQKEIAKKYNISRSYVSRIEKHALLKLYRSLPKRN